MTQMAGINGALKSPLMTPEEVSSLLALDVRAVRRLARRREIEHFAIGGEIRFTQEQVRVFLDAQRRPVACPTTDNPPANFG